MTGVGQKPAKKLAVLARCPVFSFRPCVSSHSQMGLARVSLGILMWRVRYLLCVAERSVDMNLLFSPTAPKPCFKSIAGELWTGCEIVGGSVQRFASASASAQLRSSSSTTAAHAIVLPDWLLHFVGIRSPHLARSSS